MQEHDGKANSDQFRWVLEIKDGTNVLLGDCFFIPNVIEPKPDPLLRSLAAAKQWVRPTNRQLGVDFLDVPKDSAVYQSLESLDFNKRYNVLEHVHHGNSLRIETWDLSFCRILERTFKGQPDGLFTINLSFEYYQIKHFPTDTNDRQKGYTTLTQSEDNHVTAAIPSLLL
jgi:hypothetical protein